MIGSTVGEKAAKIASKSLGEICEDVLESNKSIIKAFDKTTGLKTFLGDLAAPGGSHNFYKAAQKAKYYATDQAGNISLNYGKIAGAYVTASSAARIATGGGIYKDRNGNTNLMGIPII